MSADRADRYLAGRLAVLTAHRQRSLAAWRQLARDAVSDEAAVRAALTKLVEALDDSESFAGVNVALREARELLGRA